MEQAPSRPRSVEVMTDSAPTGNDQALRDAQQAIDEAKAAAAEAGQSESEELVDEDLPAGDAEPADGPAPAA